MSNLVLTGHSIDEIAEIEMYFDEEELLAAWKDGTLLDWLEERMEDEIAEEIRQIKKSGRGAKTKALVTALGFDYDAILHVQREKAAEEERKHRENEEKQATMDKVGGTQEVGCGERDHNEQEADVHADETDLAVEIPNPDEVEDCSAYYALYEREAAKGNAMAQYGLGMCLDTYDTRDEAMMWLRKAAEQGYAPAQCRLGFNYHLGWYDGPHDDIECVKWYRLAAEQGHEGAQYLLGSYYDEDGPHKKAREAVKWLRLAAEQEHPCAQCDFGVHLLQGNGISPNAHEAVEWFRKAARQGNSSAMRNLGLCYLDGMGVRQNRATGINWLRKAGDQGDDDDKIAVGNIFANEVGDKEEAEKWFFLALESDDDDIRARAQEAIDDLYSDDDMECDEEDGYGGDGDYESYDEDEGADYEEDDDFDGDDYGGGYGGGGYGGGNGYTGGGGILSGLKSFLGL